MAGHCTRQRLALSSAAALLPAPLSRSIATTSANDGGIPRVSTDFLQQLQQLIEDEQEVAYARLFEVWERPLADKLRKGISQGFAQLDPGPEPGTLWAWPDGSESRFREGDLLLLHQGNALTPLERQLSFEAEDESRWLLRGDQSDQVLKDYRQGACYEIGRAHV